MKINAPLILLFVILACGASCNAQPQAPAASNGFAVVELFTSEGCSSCPSAETALAEIHKKYQQNVYVIEYHVDYWNNLGWKDNFSSHAYTIRQQQYAELLHTGSTYTPQAVVNGTNELVGSDHSKLNALIDKHLSVQVNKTISVVATTKNRQIAVQYRATGTHGQLLNIVLVQKGTEMNVRNGENAGRKLKHTNIARALETITDAQGNGTIHLSLPAGLSASDCEVIAYTQQKDNWQITACAQSEIIEGAGQ